MGQARVPLGAVVSASDARRRRRSGQAAIDDRTGKPIAGPADIPDEYVFCIQKMIAMTAGWHATRAPGRPAARFRYPGRHVQIVAPWPESFERFCLNAEARELAKLFPREATVFMVYIALCEAGHEPEACTLDDLMRPSGSIVTS